jgi:hypothetical protein
MRQVWITARGTPETLQVRAALDPRARGFQTLSDNAHGSGLPTGAFLRSYRVRARIPSRFWHFFCLFYRKLE